VVLSSSQFPQIDIRMVFADRISSARRSRGCCRPHWRAATSGWWRAVYELRRASVLSPAYISRHGAGEPEALGAHQCLSFEGMSSSEIWVFRAGDVDKAITVHSRLVVNTAEAAVDAAVAGLGMARLLSYQIAAAHRLGELEIALAAFEPPPIPVSLVHAGQGRLPLKQRAFLDFAAPRLRAAIAACVLQDGPVP
jgi:DNA-binding transcriptional LysR family regulator